VKRDDIKKIVLYLVYNYNTERMDITDDKRMDELTDECCKVASRQNAKVAEQTPTNSAQQEKKEKKRFEVKNGRFGAYFYDNVEEKVLDLAETVLMLNVLYEEHRSKCVIKIVDQPLVFKG
jgi:hypothetical protein